MRNVCVCVSSVGCDSSIKVRRYTVERNVALSTKTEATPCGEQRETIDLCNAGVFNDSEKLSRVLVVLS